MYVSPRLADSTSELKDKMRLSQAKYDWFNGSTEDDIKNATLKWDTVQRNYECCGIASPKDWEEYRPDDKPDAYPASCCMNPRLVGEDKLCHNIKNVWDFGCVDSIKLSNNAVISLLTVLVWFNLILSLMACIVLFCGPKHREYESH